MPFIRLSHYDSAHLWSLITSNLNIGNLTVETLSHFVNSCWPEDSKEADIFAKLLCTVAINKTELNDLIFGKISQMLSNFEQRPYMDNKIVNRWLTVLAHNPTHYDDISFVTNYVIHRILNGINAVSYDEYIMM